MCRGSETDWRNTESGFPSLVTQGSCSLCEHTVMLLSLVLVGTFYLENKVSIKRNCRLALTGMKSLGGGCMGDVIMMAGVSEPAAMPIFFPDYSATAFFFF